MESLRENIINSIKTKIDFIYGSNQETIEYQTRRYNDIISLFESTYHETNNYSIISTPGRTELSGNHTDHNGGKVIAASINLDTVVIFSKSEKQICLKSDNYDDFFEIEIDDLHYRESEVGTTNSLIRGVTAGFVKYGFKVGGFNAVLTSDVLEGSGLSSSASIEVAIGSILNFLYNEGQIPPQMIAKIGQFAENEFFGKPCGLMDQLACAVGGIIYIDFADDSKPTIRKVDLNFEKFGYKFFVINTGATHQNLTDDYSAVPYEMESVAKYFNKKKCIELNYDMLINNMIDLRKNVSDRAILRTIHFLKENARVESQIQAIETKNIEKFLNLVNESGDSSFKFLQNIYSTAGVHEQPLSIALSVTEDCIQKHGGGACRVHGGGFAGTIQAFIKNSYVQEYAQLMAYLFGDNSINALSIRSNGPFVVKE